MESTVYNTYTSAWIDLPAIKQQWCTFNVPSRGGYREVWVDAEANSYIIGNGPKDAVKPFTWTLVKLTHPGDPSAVQFLQEEGVVTPREASLVPDGTHSSMQRINTLVSELQNAVRVEAAAQEEMRSALAEAVKLMQFYTEPGPAAYDARHVDAMKAFVEKWKCRKS